MAKGKGARPSPVEEFLDQVNPDRPFRRVYRYIPSRANVEPRYRYRIVYRRVGESRLGPLGHLSQRVVRAGSGFICWILGMLVIAGIVILLMAFKIGDPYLLALFPITLLILSVILFFMRAGSRPPRKKDKSG